MFSRACSNAPLNGVQTEYKLKCKGSNNKYRITTSADDVEKAICAFVLELRSRFREQSEQEPAEFKKQVVRLVRRYLPPRPGRPNDPRIDSAFRMIERGISVKEILRSQIRDFERLDGYGRYLAEKGLRAALARRKRSSRAKEQAS